MAYEEHAGQVRTASGINVVLGIWFIISPWAYGYSHLHQGSIWNNVIVGLVIAIFAAIRFFSPDSSIWLSWIVGLLGIWAFASPWIYEYSGNPQRLWNSIILGILVLALAIWSVSATNTRVMAGSE
ncbi:MAG TPA: SPW repeat protein [Longimicrobiaceae bacterium]|nr:SPW repeat protein [Longimicrobiaceae bacterium]